MLHLRLITGPILIALVLGLVWLEERIGGGAVPRGTVLWALSMIAMPLAALELGRFGQALGIRCESWLIAVAAALVLTAIWIAPMLPEGTARIALPLGALAASFALSLAGLARGRNVQGALAGGGLVMLGAVHLGVLPGFFLLLRHEHSAWWVVGAILVTKMCDTGAYFTGTTIGRRKLIPWLSPGKTWEGLAGGLATAAAFGLLGAWMSRAWLAPEDAISAPLGAAAGLVFGLVGQAGDLVVSLWKRDARVKDSSAVLPGLGGLLDVLDSALLVAPVAWLMLAAP